MFIAECVLVYMEPQASQSIIKWVASQFTSAVFLNYEPVSVVMIMVKWVASFWFQSTGKLVKINPFILD